MKQEFSISQDVALHIIECIRDTSNTWGDQFIDAEFMEFARELIKKFPEMKLDEHRDLWWLK